MRRFSFFFFFFNDTATTEIYTLSLHDALPILAIGMNTDTTTYPRSCAERSRSGPAPRSRGSRLSAIRSEEHTSELQSPCNLVCRLLLEKKKEQALIPWEWCKNDRIRDCVLRTL